MKKLLPILLATAMLSTGLSATVRAADTDPQPKGCGGERAGWMQKRAGGRLERLAGVLNLTEDQKAQIKQIYESERPVMKPLVKEMWSSRRELRKTLQAGTFDEAAVRPLAQKEAQAQADLLVERARLHSKVFAVLTPDQQEQMRALRPLLSGGHRGSGAF